MPQEIRMAAKTGRPSSHRSFRCPYHATVMNTLEPMSRRMTLDMAPDISGLLRCPQEFKTGENPRKIRLKIPKTDRKSTRLNSSHLGISYAVFCLDRKS